MVGLRLLAPETLQVRVLSVCPTIRGVLRLAITTTEMGRAGGRLSLIFKINRSSYKTRVMIIDSNYASIIIIVKDLFMV